MKKEDVNIITIGRCGTCGYRTKEGQCSNRHIIEPMGIVDSEREIGAKIDKRNCLIYSYDEGGWFDVGENFGCVHYWANGEAWTFFEEDKNPWYIGTPVKD